MTVAYYARQSKEKPNDTIENQFAIIDSYIGKQKDLCGAKIAKYSDDGFTGLNVERDAFQELMGLVRERKINTVAVKDFSRLGRNYLDVIKLTESIFPFMGVRVIAVSDNYDSKYSKSEPMDLLVSLKAVLNEMHVTDLSDKLRKAFAQRTRDGKFYGNIAYGYTLADLNTPVIDGEKAEIVREIFNAYLAGKSSLKIAGELNDRGLRTNRGSLWTVQAIRIILRNEQYIGKKEGLKHHRDLKNHGWTNTPESHRYIKEDAFPPIIERDVFARAQALLPKKAREPPVQKHIMSRKLYCGHCGRTLHRQGDFRCRNGYVTGGASCFKGAVKPSTLYPLVIKDVSAYIGGELARVGEFSATRVRKTEAEAARLKEKMARLYEAFLAGRITEQDFARQKRVISDTFEKVSATLDKLREHEAMFSKLGKAERPIDTLRRLYNAQTLTLEHMQFVRRINIYSTEQYEIILYDESPLAVLCKNVPLYDEN